MNKYNNIKSILRKQVEAGVRTLWQFNEKNNEFIQIYKNYDDILTIYTPQQLLTKLEKTE